MEKALIKIKLDLIQDLKKRKGEPWRSVREYHLRKELIDEFSFGVNEFEDYIIYKTTNSNTSKPYIQIYSKKSWENSQKFLAEEKRIEEKKEYQTQLELSYT